MLKPRGKFWDHPGSKWKPGLVLVNNLTIGKVAGERMIFDLAKHVD